MTRGETVAWGASRSTTAALLAALELGPLLGENTRELEPGDTELRHDDLAEAFTGLLLQLQSARKLVVRDEIPLHQDGADQARLKSGG